MNPHGPPGPPEPHPEPAVEFIESNVDLSTTVPANTGFSDPVLTETGDDEVDSHWFDRALIVFPSAASGELGFRVSAPGAGNILPGNRHARTDRDAFLRNVGVGTQIEIPLGVKLQDGPIRARFFNETGSDERVLLVLMRDEFDGGV